MSVERVGGVEPETVDEFLEDGHVVLWRVREKGASEDEWSAWTDFDFESSHEFYDRSMVEVEEVKFVPVSALRSVEEELRQAREERDAALKRQVVLQEVIGLSAHHALATHCKHGHEFTPENTYMDKGKRQCRECQRRRGAEYRARKRARHSAPQGAPADVRGELRDHNEKG